MGLERAGMECAFQVEIDFFCLRVLERHWPSVPRYGDIRQVRGDELPPVDLLAGGFPCQDLSVAGYRAGLAGERSGLFFEFMRLVADVAPRWVLIENVPGLLSSNGGRDMATVIGSLAELGYGYAWRVLDAQYFGVPQRRRRVFVVGCLGDWRRAAEVLFEPESGAGNSPPGREEGQVVASLLASGAGTDRPAGVASEPDFLVVTQALTCTYANGGADDNKAQAGFWVAHSITASRSGMRFDPTEEDFVVLSVGRASCPTWAEELAQPVTSRHADPGHVAMIQLDPASQHAVSYTLRRDPGGIGQGHNTTYVTNLSSVRRLTPKECERLQGFPDDWTLIEPDTPDSLRYRTLGNAVAVPVAKWIGRRILEAEEEKP